MDDIIKMLPVAFCAMGAHCASIFALSTGAVSFGQIVKAAEPIFAAVLSQFVYGKKLHCQVVVSPYYYRWRGVGIGE
jgi:solute carrier family 35 protein E1